MAKEKRNFTEKQISDYIANGTHRCPLCKSRAVTYGDIVRDSNTQASKWGECGTCCEKWIVVLSITNIIRST